MAAPVEAGTPGHDDRHDALSALCRSALALAATGGLSRLAVRDGEISVELEWAPPAGPSTLPARDAPVPEGAEHTEPGTREIRSPMVGTFYRSPEPGAPPFVAVGDRVRPGQQVGIVEAMKLMNPVESDVAGEVRSIPVADGEPVGYDAALVVVVPDGEAPA